MAGWPWGPPEPGWHSPKPGGLSFPHDPAAPEPPWAPGGPRAYPKGGDIGVSWGPCHCTLELGTSGCCGVPRVHPGAGHTGVPLLHPTARQVGVPWGPTAAPQGGGHWGPLGRHCCTPKPGTPGCHGVPWPHPRAGDMGVLRGPTAAPQSRAHRGPPGCHQRAPGLSTSGCRGVPRPHPKAGDIRVPIGPVPAPQNRAPRGAVGRCGARGVSEPPRGRLWPWGRCPPGRLGPRCASPGVTGVTAGGGAPCLSFPPGRAVESRKFPVRGAGGGRMPGGGGRMPGGPRRPYNARPRRPRHRRRRCHAR